MSSLGVYSMYADDEPAASALRQQDQPKLTAFRAAEKAYQLHKDQVVKLRRGRRVGKGYTVRPTDLSEVIDVDGALPQLEVVQTISLADLGGVTGPPHTLPACGVACIFPSHPGLLLVRNAMSAQQQRQMVVDALSVFPEPPAHTNHTRQLGALPGLWRAAQAGLRLQQVQQVQEQQPQQQRTAHTESDTRTAQPCCTTMSATATTMRMQHLQQDDLTHAQCTSPGNGPWSADGSGPAAATLLRKLRWATLGPPFDWTNRVYLREAAHTPLPVYLQCLAKELAALAAQLANGGQRGIDAEQQQVEQQVEQQAGCFDAAIVNYYYEGDTLGGHKDDAELDMRIPIVALSLGCPAVFLMGGQSRDVPPTALLLRSGDAVVLSGPARACYHGVPRVFTGELAEALSCSNVDQFAPFFEHMRTCRINISIRDTQ